MRGREMESELADRGNGREMEGKRSRKTHNYATSIYNLIKSVALTCCLPISLRVRSRCPEARMVACHASWQAWGEDGREPSEYHQTCRQEGEGGREMVV